LSVRKGFTACYALYKDVATKLADPDRKTVATAHAQPNPELLAAFQQLVGEVFRLHGLLLQTAETISHGLGLSVARWQILGILLRFEALTVADIARRVGLRRQSVQQTVNGLRDQDMLEPTPNPKHKTAPLIRMTDKGRLILPELLKRQAILTQWFTDHGALSADRMRALCDQLEYMRDNAKKNSLKCATDPETPEAGR
jgi:DNA-binding MarR family transcriptional regulator